MNSYPLYAPDGMRVAGATSDHFADMRRSGSAGTPFSTVRERMGVVLPHERHDDGLVHNHAWAVTTAHRPRETGAGYFETAAMPATAGSSPTTRAHAFDRAQLDERYDDGLVHNHHWAVTAE
ncbi:MAG TPA: hypothetical protein PLD10_22800 [Rhodopila sp.]|nr:hypothetical protein [Rhodopila sp.]